MTRDLEPQELPNYRCHKVVRAAKIIEVVELTPGGAGMLHLDWNGEARTFPVTASYLARHNPKPGGYFVLYDDGYRSWSPAEAFEEGYRRMAQRQPLEDGMAPPEVEAGLRKLAESCMHPVDVLRPLYNRLRVHQEPNEVASYAPHWAVFSALSLLLDLARIYNRAEEFFFEDVHRVLHDLG